MITKAHVANLLAGNLDRRIQPQQCLGNFFVELWSLLHVMHRLPRAGETASLFILRSIDFALKVQFRLSHYFFSISRFRLGHASLVPLLNHHADAAHRAKVLCGCVFLLSLSLGAKDGKGGGRKLTVLSKNWLLEALLSSRRC